MKNRLEKLGQLSKLECDEWLNKANVLVNVGNSVTNQVPSKLFDYISKGKCILNTYKNYNCPTLKYLKNYSLAINVFEKTELNNDSVKFIETQIKNYMSKTISFSLIEKKYFNCTPIYVSNQILNVLQGRNDL